jgi:hypothetical protein
MSQAETTNTSKTLSRRSAIALVCGSAITAGAASVGGAPTRGPIGELSYPELAKQFDVIYERWRVTRDEDIAHREEYEARLFEVTGIRREDSPNHGEVGHREYMAAVSRVSEELPDGRPTDDHGCDVVWIEIHDELFPLLKEIARRPARTLADLALKARAIAIEECGPWTTTSEWYLEFSVLAVRALVDDLCALAGVEVLPGIDILSIEECMEEGEGE